MNTLGKLLRFLLVVIAIASLLFIVGLAVYSHYNELKPGTLEAAEEPVVPAPNANIDQEKMNLEKKLEEASRKIELMEQENKLLKGSYDRFENEKAVILEQVKDSISGFAEYKQDTSEKIEKLNSELKKLEEERDNLKSNIEDISTEAASNQKLYDNQILALNSQIDKHKNSVGKLKELIQKKEKDTIVAEASKLHYNLGNFYFRNQQYDHAAAEYKKALVYRPNDPDIHYNLAVVYDEHLGLNKDAVTHYKRYLLLNPTDENCKKIENRILDLEINSVIVAGNTLANKKR